MESEDTKIKSLKERRFCSIIFLLRLGGIPFQMKKLSTIYAVYMITVIICASTTYLGTFVDVYVYWDDLGHAMTTKLVFISMSNGVWMYFCCRYVMTRSPPLQQHRYLFKKTKHYILFNDNILPQIY
jgi:hypothetical protein